MACTRSSIVFVLCSGLAVWGVGCGDDSEPGNDSGGSSSGGAVTGDSGNTGGPGSTGGGTTMEPGTSDAEGSSGDSGGTTMGGDSGDTTAGDSTSAGETEAGACADLDGPACMMTAGCMPVGGQELMRSAEGPCWGARAFVECQEQMACGEAITYACRGDDGPQWQFGNTCTPTAWVDCGPPPPVEIPDCMD